jgi:hypothetical protein
MAKYYCQNKESEQIVDSEKGIIWTLFNDELFLFSGSQTVVSRKDIAVQLFAKLKLEVPRNNYIIEDEE